MRDFSNVTHFLDKIQEFYQFNHNNCNIAKILCIFSFVFSQGIKFNNQETITSKMSGE